MCLEESWTKEGFIVALVSEARWRGNRYGSNFSVPNKFIIFLLCSLLVDGNTYLKAYIF